MNSFQKFPKKAKAVGSIPKLMARLDRIFSEYIRRRDADKQGYCRCITCGGFAHWKNMDAGHFIQRDRKATRYDPHNVNAQCPHCNRFRSGEQFKHGQAIDNKFGKGTANLLKHLSMVSTTKLDAAWLEYHIEMYKKKLKELKEKC